MPPGGHPQLAAGFALSVAAASKNKVPAYLFIQWLNSQDISIERVQLPYALRDPFRDSHFASAEYKSRWPRGAAISGGAAGRCRQRAAGPVADPDRQVRGGASARACRGSGPARTRKAILDDVAAQWDAITERIGVDKQRAAYEAWASKPNAYPTAT